MTTTTAGDPDVSSDRYQNEYQPSFVDRWDDLIDWEGRAEGEKDFFEKLLRDEGCSRVLDAAAGTGYHAVTLADAGFDVVAADGARTMLSKTTENMRRQDVQFPRVQADWRELDDAVPGSFDAVLCLGNAFTHLFSREEREQAMEQFHRVLDRGGIAVIDQRNYDSILDHGYSSKHQYYYCGQNVDARPVEITDDHVRFEYTFPDGAVHHLTLYPIRIDQLTELMVDAGFHDIRTYGDFKADWNEADTDFVVQVGRKTDVQVGRK